MNNQAVNIILEDVEEICSRVNLEELSGKSFLITGASGLVGTYFLACLKYFSTQVNNSIKVWAVVQSDPSTYLMELADFPGARIIKGDLSDGSFCQSLPRADYIVHSACYAQPGKFLANPAKTIKLNTFSTFFLLDKLEPQGKFLFVSSSEIYSGLQSGCHKETDVGTVGYDHPRYCYIEGKRCGEAICNSYRASGVNAKSVRLSLAYGPGTRLGDTRVMPAFIEKALNNGQINLLDNGSASRTYCYIADAVTMMWHVLLRGTETVYNVGGQSSVTIGELAKQIGNYLNVPVIFPENQAGSLAGSPAEVSLDMSRTEKEFGKFINTDFTKGLKNTIAWIKFLHNS